MVESLNFAWVLYDLNTSHFCIKKVFVTGKNLMASSYLEVSLKICKVIFKWQILLEYCIDEICHLKPVSCPFLLLSFLLLIKNFAQRFKFGHLCSTIKYLDCSFQDFGLLKLCMQANLYYHFNSKTYGHK